MSAAKHTTLPLETVGNLVRTTIVHGGYLVAECRDRNGIKHNEESKANALLFAGASDLLEALHQLAKCAAVSVTTETEEFSLAMAKARTAIGKATGSAT